MKIKRETITRVMIDDTTTLVPADTVKFIANGVCYFGSFVGISKRGALQFYARVGMSEITFCVMPGSIESIEVIEHVIE